MHAAKQCIEFTEVDGAYVQDAHPELRQLFLFCVIFIRLRLGAQVRIVVTSVMRTYGVHGARRGLDFLVESNTAMTIRDQFPGSLMRARLAFAFSTLGICMSASPQYARYFS